jgi:hypothetical protein
VNRAKKPAAVNAPTKIAPTDPSGKQPIIRVRPEELSDDDLARIAAAGSGGTPEAPAGA